jgi:peptidoglycan/LPS O-acetylase OafA/YrhL
MTGIIFRGIEQERFSIMRFYISRANRIIPALAVLCLALLVFGWFYLTSLDYKTLGKHVGSSIGFLSNIIYWGEAGYFDAASHEKWLLHTWSLSVEWQFYIIYPLVLVAMRKFTSLNTMKLTVLIGALLGFIFCVMATSKWPNLAYYLLPTRAWEMMVGGIAYLYPLKIKKDNNVYFEWTGLVLIVLSYVFVSKENSWPGYLSVIPVFGAFLVIQAQRNNSIITGNVIFQYIGKWSYSIYLWHWPLVVAIYYFSLNEGFVYFGLALSIALGFLSNKYIESIDFRNDFKKFSQYIKCKPIYLVFLTGLLGSNVFIQQGYEDRNDREYRAKAYHPEHYDYCFEKVKEKSIEYCVFHSDGSYSRSPNINGVSVIVLGDSHASSIVDSILDSMRRSGDRGDLLFYGHPGCLPLEDDISEIVQTTFADSCNYRNNHILEIIKSNSNKKTKIILSNRMAMYIYGMNELNYDKPYQNLHYMSKSHDLMKNKELVFLSHRNLISNINTLGNDIYMVYPIPEQKVNIPKINGRNAMLNRPEHKGLKYDEYMGSSI